MPGERNHFLGEALSAVRETICDNDLGRRTHPPLVGSAPALRTQEPRNLVRAAAEPLTAASARKASTFIVSDLFLGRVGQLKAVEFYR